MNVTSAQFLLPLTFPSISTQPILAGHPHRSQPIDVLQASCSAAEPSILVSWALSGSSCEQNSDVDNGPHTKGVVMGCKDGSFYVFHSTPSPATPIVSRVQVSEPNEESPTSPSLSRPHSPLLPRQLPRSASPLLLSTFQLAPRSRVVSGLSTELVEAPKTFVDFDDEPDKLKDLLKGRIAKDKSTPSLLLPNSEKPLPVVPSISAAELGPTTRKRKSGPRSLLSATNSPPFTPVQLSGPTSPGSSSVISQASSSQQLKLICHTIPFRAAPDNPVVGMSLFNDNRLFVALHAQGDLSVFKTRDGVCICATQVENLSHPYFPSAKGAPHRIWRWTSLQGVHTEEPGVLISLATATADLDVWSASPEGSDDHVKDNSHFILFECRIQGEHDSKQAQLSKLCEWCLDGQINGVGLTRNSDDTLTLLYISTNGNLTSRQIKPPPRFPAPVPSSSSQDIGHSLSLPLPNPFKGILPKLTENATNAVSNKQDSNMTQPAECDMGPLFPNNVQTGLRTRIVENKLRGIAWSDQEIRCFEFDGNSQQLFFVSSAKGTRDIIWIDDHHYAVILGDRAEVSVLKTVDANNDDVDPIPMPAGPLIVNLHLLHSHSFSLNQAPLYISATELLCTTVGQGNRREIRIISVDNPSQTERAIWKASPSEARDLKSEVQLSAILPVEPNKIILGYDDGRLRQSAFSLMAAQPGHSATLAMISAAPVDGPITMLCSVRNDRTGERFVVGGVDDGSICFWSLESLQLCARWIVFTSPLSLVAQYEDEGVLRGCVLCIAFDGTIAVILVDGFQFLYLIPGSAAQLSRVHVHEDNILLVYKDARARIWNAKTREFWRSMTLDKAEEFINQGGWLISLTECGERPPPSMLLRPVAGHAQGLDSVSSVLLDFERFVSEAVTAVKLLGVGEARSRPMRSILNQLRVVLSILLTPSINEDIDDICTKKLGIAASCGSLGFSTSNHICIYASENGKDAWCISPEASAARALSIMVLLRVMASFEELSEAANTVMTFYAMSLASAVGRTYQPPSLMFLAQRWFDGSNEMRQSARILFDSTVTHLSDEDSSILVEKLQHNLPCLQPSAERELPRSALALFICGHVAAEQYSLLSTGTLTDTSKSITLYLNDEQSMYRVMAIDLCSRGFQVWQNYVDAMEMLRTIFRLATNNSKQAITTQNVGTHARLAVLQIASSNTPVFMTTMGLDILSPRSVEHRKSVLQIFAFLIRKRPLVLYPNLPRLMEAVVKSLDPNSTAGREAVLDTATEIIGQVVKTFPTVDFHMASQRLAVGTNEGAIVMYDLKTATRLFVLEGHFKRLAACSFSPDGRRLVTVSLEESVVRVWKVGSSFSSFFNPGAPPRQGSAGSSPFKTLSFNVGNEANMTIAGTLEWLSFEWTADRSVKLKIKDSVLTFST